MTASLRWLPAVLLVAGLAFGQSPAGAPPPDVAAPDASAIDAVHIVPALPGDPVRLPQVGIGNYLAGNQPLRTLVANLWHVSPARIVFTDKPDDAKYNVSADLRRADPDQVVKAVQVALERHFGWSVRSETRPVRVYVLQPGDQPSTQIRPSKEGEFTVAGGGPGMVMGSAAPLSQMTAVFEQVLDTPVIDETHLSGNFDYSASSRIPAPQSIFEMARELGFKLTEAQRPVEMLVVSKIP